MPSQVVSLLVSEFVSVAGIQDFIDEDGARADTVAVSGSPLTVTVSFTVNNSSVNFFMML